MSPSAAELAAVLNRPQPTPVSVSVKDAAAIAGISRSKAYYLVGRGELAGAYRMGGRVLVHVPTLLAWIESEATKIAPGRTVQDGPPSVAASPERALRSRSTGASS